MQKYLTRMEYILLVCTLYVRVCMVLIGTLYAYIMYVRVRIYYIKKLIVHFNIYNWKIYANTEWFLYINLKILVLYRRYCV